MKADSIHFLHSDLALEEKSSYQFPEINFDFRIIFSLLGFELGHLMLQRGFEFWAFSLISMAIIGLSYFLKDNTTDDFKTWYGKGFLVLVSAAAISSFIGVTISIEMATLFFGATYALLILSTIVFTVIHFYNFFTVRQSN